MRPGLALLIVIGAMVGARADVVVLGPAAEERVRPQTVADATRAIERAGLARGAADIGPACASDLECTANTGAQLAATRVVTVTLDEDGGQVTVQLVLVDITAREVLGRRTAQTRKLDRELGPLIAKLADEAPIERAKELMASGNQHYSLGELAEALVAYRRAYQLAPRAEFLFNIAQCHRRLGQHAEAITMYQSYLAGVPDAENTALVEELIAESKAAIADAERRERERLAAEAKRAEELRRISEADAAAAAERRRAAEARSKKSILPWIAIGVGAAAIIGGGLLYATSETDDGSQPTYRDTRPAGIGVAIGGAALAGGGLLWMTRF